MYSRSIVLKEAEQPCSELSPLLTSTTVDQFMVRKDVITLDYPSYLIRPQYYYLLNIVMKRTHYKMIH